jgi:hypothetical protein
LAVIFGFALCVPLAVAYRLEPSPQNRGTHEQLGLPPCSFVVWFGRPCPACGMTTSWAHLIRGNLIGALRANVGGTLLGILTLVAIPWLLLSVALGRWIAWVPNSDTVAWVGTAIVIVMLIDWGVRLMIG